MRGVVSNEEVFWSILQKNIPECIGIGTADLDIPIETKLAEIKPSLVIQNANLGKVSNYKTISFLQDPALEMKKHFESFQTRIRAKIRGRETLTTRLKKQIESFEGSTRVTNSNYMVNMYKKYGDFHVIPMGVDNDLFRPLDKKEMRKKYGIPPDSKVNIFVGSTHPVKGFSKIQKMIQDDSRIFWILVLKDVSMPAGHNYAVFHKVPHSQLVELYSCADLCVSRSVTESFGLAMVEAMFCDVPVDTTKVGVFWDWQPDFLHPRKSAFDFGLDKNTWMNRWKGLVDSLNS